MQKEIGVYNKQQNKSEGRRSHWLWTGGLFISGKPWPSSFYQKSMIFSSEGPL